MSKDSVLAIKLEIYFKLREFLPKPNLLEIADSPPTLFAVAKERRKEFHGQQTKRTRSQRLEERGRKVG